MHNIHTYPQYEWKRVKGNKIDRPLSIDKSNETISHTHTRARMRKLIFYYDNNVRSLVRISGAKMISNSTYFVQYEMLDYKIKSVLRTVNKLIWYKMLILSLSI